MNTIPMPSPHGTNHAKLTLPSGRGFNRCGPIAGHERSPPQYAYDSATPTPAALPFSDSDAASAARIDKLLAFLASRLSAQELLAVARMLTTDLPASNKNRNDAARIYAEDAAFDNPHTSVLSRFPELRRIKPA
ncbi:hypothetical protein [Methylocystis sp.]|uniref:hypothetical protein n=1 Tax=Methylocystis sp. TaxID=1911079 RepID=UPI0025ED74E6|nr:hypothetical protein [Methylocystis sp.]